MKVLSSVACTHQGRRDNNEDAHLVQPETSLYLVADGMGGYEGGEVASRIAVETISAFFERNAADKEVTWPFALARTFSYTENLLNVAILMAHAGVCAAKQGRLGQMGSTVAALVLSNGQAVIGHVGDSRIYCLRGGEFIQLTRDHSLLTEMQRAGMELTDQARSNYGNVVTRALGAQRADPEVTSVGVRPGDRFLLCTDGLLERLDDGAIARELGRGTTEDACRRLVDLAFSGGSKDNITAVVVECGG